MKNWIIKKLGGYTKDEYLRVERKYYGLLDSKTNTATVKQCNEVLYKNLQILDKYAQEKLFGLIPSVWAKRMYNIIHNNLLRLAVRYINSNSAVLYYLDTTLTEDKEFENIMKSEGLNEEFFILEND